MLGADIDDTLPELQRQAESRMKDTATVGVFTDGTDEETGDPIRVLVAERYSGKARIRWASRQVSNAQGPSMPLAVQEPYLSIPVGSPRLFIGDEVLCSASPDPMLAGRRFMIEGSAVAGQVTAYRYPLLEVS